MLDLREMFVPQESLLEIAVRGALVYVGLFTLLRVVLKRQSGGMGVSDLLVLVLLADAAQNAMSAEYKSVTAGFVLVATIIVTSYFLDWLAYRFRNLEWFVYPAPLLLVKDGHMLVENMRKELISRGELLSQLRQQGISNVSEVKEAFMEGDGTISVLREDHAETGESTEKKKQKSH